MIRMITEIQSKPIQWTERREKKRKKCCMPALHYSAGWMDGATTNCMYKEGY